ncbi:heparan-alpha-glucosaminide N-acetyltransferase [Phreatobacter sp.]|uniref:heparan-alpha-glucosaminide N-acetyltransferase n=1 Tax=Phreatobacter sp. TaxID=1966341 RepID=UPI003F7138C9
MTATGAAAPPPRLPLVDVARGVAIMAMVVFHFAFDLSQFGLIATDIAGHPGWRLFAGSIGGSFLALVGVSLVLAARGGLDRMAFLRRLAMVAGGAALVTAATLLAVPHGWIFFGILHLIAVASVLGLAFLRLPAAVVALAAVAAFALPWLVAHPALDQPWLLFTGLSRVGVTTADFYPLLPWSGFVLAGMAAARFAVDRGLDARLAAIRAEGRLPRLIGRAGRHSLAIYLIHQPVLIALVWMLAQVLPTAPRAPVDDDARPFLATCTQTCMQAGKPADLCRFSCTCVIDGLKRETIWPRVLADRLSPADQERTAAIARTCHGGE